MRLDDSSKLFALRRRQVGFVVHRVEKALQLPDGHRRERVRHLEDLLDVVLAEHAGLSSGAVAVLRVVLRLDNLLDDGAVEPDDEDETVEVEEELHRLEHLQRAAG